MDVLLQGRCKRRVLRQRLHNHLLVIFDALFYLMKSFECWQGFVSDPVSEIFTLHIQITSSFKFFLRPN